VTNFELTPGMLCYQYRW